MRIENAADIPVALPQKSAAVIHRVAERYARAINISEKEVLKRRAEPGAQRDRDLYLRSDVRAAPRLEEGVLDLIRHLRRCRGAVARVHEYDRAVFEKQVQQVRVRQIVTF